MRLSGTLALAFALLGTTAAPALSQTRAQATASQSVTHVRVFEGPN